MKNVYQNSDMVYSEIAEALDDYNYGGTCKLYIPSVSALMPHSTVKVTRRNTKDNIMNKEKDILGISTYTSSSYIELPVPLHMCPSCGGSSNIDHIVIGDCEVYHIHCAHEGHKGDKFMITFIEGDTQKCNIVGRYQG